MAGDLERSFPFEKRLRDGLHRLTALDQRVVFLLKENPEKKILHTVQVERNGFIESVLSGTSLEEVDYAYFGDRAYSRFIRTD